PRSSDASRTAAGSTSWTTRSSADRVGRPGHGSTGRPPLPELKGEVVVDPPYPVPGGWLDRYGWAIVRERVETLVEESRFRIAFLCGSAENEADVRDLFDLIVCLVVDEATLHHRLATRTTNTFSQHPEELAAALKRNPRMRAIYKSRGATIIDVSKPVIEVVDSVIDAVQGLPRSTR
ncbi:hypothetical protein ACGFY3_46475, partial [Streptomyces mirabilis]|uniref:hypothetical protein n=1 Tax=Streptomyces mirabilis TaxID=68239 RepID=UPI003718DCAE